MNPDRQDTGQTLQNEDMRRVKKISLNRQTMKS